MWSCSCFFDLYGELHDPVKKVRFAAVERLKDKSIEIN